MFDIRGYVLRFGNVVGPRQTHGVGFDFIRRLIEDPRRLRILGDGRQSKSYIHVDDVVDAALLVLEREPAPFRAFNVATGDYITVREIAALAMQCLGLQGVEYEFTGGERGWKGDVPVVRLNTDRIRALGWRNRFGSQEALRRSLEAMAPLAHTGRL
jgi:UDP-glucose 4-epimerase